MVQAPEFLVVFRFLHEQLYNANALDGFSKTGVDFGQLNSQCSKNVPGFNRKYGRSVKDDGQDRKLCQGKLPVENQHDGGDPD